MLVTATKHQKLELVFPNSKTPHAFYRYYERIYFMFLFDNRGIFHQPLKNITATKATITSNTVRTMYIKIVTEKSEFTTHDEFYSHLGHAQRVPT